MEKISIVPKASDRMATREEWCQVKNLFEGITAGQGLIHSSVFQLSLPIAGREAASDATRLWLDIHEEPPGPGDEDAGPESLSTLFPKGDVEN
jgi:hypothetical protein